MGETADEAGRAGRSDKSRRETRIVVLLSAMVVAATTLGAVVGYLLAWDADGQHETSRREALTTAIGELRAAGANLDDLGPQQLTALGQNAGIADLRVEMPPVDSDQNIRSITDQNGRIVGWLEWDRQNPVRNFMDRLAPFLALAALGALGLGSFAIRQMRRRDANAEPDDHSQPSQIDWLTALPNQYRMRELVIAALDARRPDEIIVYGFADIDRFEEANHSLGAGQGDLLLVEFAARLKEAFAPGIVARLGGDCFAFFLSVPDVETAQRIAEAACRAVARPYRIALGVQLTAGIGFSMAPRDGVLRDDLARRSLLALHAAKRKGRGTVAVFSAEMEADVEEKSFIKRDLSRALTDHALEVHYQPIVTSDGGVILGVEALLRWKHPLRGNIPPALFVPVAEESGLMDRLGQFVLRRALADAADWPGLFVSVNLSPLQVRDPAFVGIVSSLLSEAHFDPSRLVLEVTEGVLISDPEETKARLEELRSLGVRLALDDFGSGYSSLSYLQRLPFDKLKVDRGFVAGLAASANGGVIIQAVVALGRALGMSVLVEGVETEEQRILLRLAGCEEMQGYLFSRPVPREQIDQLLAGMDEPGRLRSSA